MFAHQICFLNCQVAARQSAIAAGLPIIPGTDSAISTPEEAVAFCESHGVPVIFKAGVYPFFSSVADTDSGSFAFLTPGSGIRNRFFPDPG